MEDIELGVGKCNVGGTICLIYQTIFVYLFNEIRNLPDVSIDSAIALLALHYRLNGIKKERKCTVRLLSKIIIQLKARKRLLRVR